LPGPRDHATGALDRAYATRLRCLCQGRCVCRPNCLDVPSEHGRVADLQGCNRCRSPEGQLHDDRYLCALALQTTPLAALGFEALTLDSTFVSTARGRPTNATTSRQRSMRRKMSMVVPVGGPASDPVGVARANTSGPCDTVSKEPGQQPVYRGAHPGLVVLILPSPHVQPGVREPRCPAGIAEATPVLSRPVPTFRQHPEDVEWPLWQPTAPATPSQRAYPRRADCRVNNRRQRAMFRAVRRTNNLKVCRGNVAHVESV